MSIASQVFNEVAAMERGYEMFQTERIELTKKRPIDDIERTLVELSWEMAAPGLMKESALVWVAPEMVDLLRHASASLTPYAFDPSILPWPNALVVAAKPLLERQVPISLIQWSQQIMNPSNKPVGWEEGCCVVAALERLTRDRDRYGDVVVPFHCMWLPPGYNPAELDHLDSSITEVEQREQTDIYARLICTLWLLLKQRVAIQRKAIPTRGERRRWIREEQGPLPEVTIVELRRPLNTEPFKGESGFVDWSHRWIVDGHWRNQYHPSTEEHIPTWIAPYVKGPDDKPLLVSRKVHAWTR